jgi:hypothetical protein
MTTMSLSWSEEARRYHRNLFLPDRKSLTVFECLHLNEATLVCLLGLVLPHLSIFEVGEDRHMAEVRKR